MKQREYISPPRGGVVIPVRALAGLFRSDASNWERIITALERSEGPMRSFYAPMFNALVAEMKQAGSGQLVLELGQEGFSDNPTSNRVKENSQLALKHFSTTWIAEYPALIEEFPDGGTKHQPVPFGDYYLKGGFHALAMDRTGQEVLLAFHASKWPTNDARATYLELLTVIAEERHGMQRGSVRLLDFSEREIVIPHSTFLNVRKELLRTCRLYSRIFGNR